MYTDRQKYVKNNEAGTEGKLSTMAATTDIIRQSDGLFCNDLQVRIPLLY